MSKSTPRKRTTRATDATSKTGTRKRSAARSPAAKTAARKEAATRKSLAAAGEARAGRQSQEPNEEALTLADYAEQVQTAVRAASAKKAEKIMMKEIRSLVDQMTDAERAEYLVESLFLNTVTYENERLGALIRKLPHE